MVSIFLISFVIIAYFSLFGYIFQQKTKILVQADLFQSAHSIASILEDKTYLQLPLELFLETNKTNTMTMTEVNQNFQVIIPDDLIKKDQKIKFVLIQNTFFTLTYHQLTVMANKEFQGHLLSGYANCFIK